MDEIEKGEKEKERCATERGRRTRSWREIHESGWGDRGHGRMREAGRRYGDLMGGAMRETERDPLGRGGRRRDEKRGWKGEKLREEERVRGGRGVEEEGEGW